MLVKRERWLSGRQVIYLLGMVELTGKEATEQIEHAEAKALDTLRHSATRWGIRKIKRGMEAKSTVAYPEKDVLAYMDRCEKEADERMKKR